MCGINFIFDKKGILDETPVERMNAASSSRGPDHSDVRIVRLRGKNYFFGCNRLKITDLSDRANQPFVSDSEAHVLVYNGEIYNFHDLKNKLIRKGWSFRSASDTEVALYALMDRGEAVLPELNGMFAFVYFDAAEEKIIAARDAFGMKPLFYFENENFLVISSSIKSILASQLTPRELNESQIPHYLRFRYARKPETFYRHIRELEEKRVLVKTKDQQKQMHAWQNEPPDGGRVNLSVRQTLHKAEEALYDALLRHVSGDTQCGLFLSGGVDSTLLLALARQENIRLPTFTMVHESPAGDFGVNDQKYARRAVGKYGSALDHHEITYDHEILDDFDDLLANLDQPIGDSALLLTRRLAAYASQSVRAALSGAGADELFAGYNRHAAFRHYLKYHALYKRLAPFTKKISSALPTGFSHPARKKFQLMKKFLSGLDKDAFQTFVNFTSLEFPVKPQRSGDMSPSGDLLLNALLHDQSRYLISDVLAVNDRAGMMESLELRAPYLDSELANFARSLDADTLMKNGRKWILKALLEKYGGSEFCGRAKEGFGAPFGSWLRAPALKRFENDFTKAHETVNKFVDIGSIKKLYFDHIRKRADNSLELWSYLTLVRWLKQEFD